MHSTDSFGAWQDNIWKYDKITTLCFVKHSEG